jgi:hypothetical protein
MPPQEVYLDHLIQRESLRYKRSTITDDSEHKHETSQTLRISDLIGDHMSSRRSSLRKPDFQRPTWAWTADDCFLLLDSLVKEQVIPSIIMWSSKDSGYDFILDGAHRISVVMAWLTDDWGDKLSEEEYGGDEQIVAEIKSAARVVREHVNLKIGSFASYEAANTEFERIVEKGEDAPKKVMDPRTFEKAQFFRKLKSGHGFHILWVYGDYETAEKSFLKINKSGKILDEWETKLIENRNSCFARTVMSLANIDSVVHYWPTVTQDDLPDEDLDPLAGKVHEIVSNLQSVSDILFKPAKPAIINKLTLPFMDISERFKRPYWTAELLTILEGYQGAENDTKKLLARGQDSGPKEIILAGHQLTSKAKQQLEHLMGSTQRSLNVVPALYFYTGNGRYVRSLLYGFIAWMLAGTDAEILDRKRVFSAYRDGFEKVLFDRKEDSATAITRAIGSGPEVTRQTALYYDRLMMALVNHKGDIYNDAFREDYATIVKGISNKKPNVGDLLQSKGRTFSTRMKNEKMLETIVSHAPTCGICRGILDLGHMDVQHDHKDEWAKGGKTSADNQRLTHPFCNNNANRHIIEGIRAGSQNVRLPYFSGEEDSLLKQMNFFKEIKYS